LIGFTLLLMSLAGIKRSGFDFPCPFGRKMRGESHGNGPVVSRPGLRDHQGSLAGSKYRNITPRTMDVETAMLYGQRPGEKTSQAHACGENSWVIAGVNVSRYKQ
jgi:hypothetical protein